MAGSESVLWTRDPPFERGSASKVATGGNFRITCPSLRFLMKSFYIIKMWPFRFMIRKIPWIRIRIHIFGILVLSNWMQIGKTYYIPNGLTCYRNGATFSSFHVLYTISIVKESIETISLFRFLRRPCLLFLISPLNQFMRYKMPHLEFIILSMSM